jgi:hypothetical protein
MAKGSFQTEDPITFGGCIGWMDATDTSTITSSSGLVSRIENKANGQLPFIQAVSSYQPQTGVGNINGKNGLTFNGTSNLLRCDGLAAAISGDDKPLSAFVVFKPENSLSAGTTFSFANSANSTALFMHDNGAGINFRVTKRDDATGLIQASTTISALNAVSVLSMSCAGTTLKAFKDGVSFYNSTFNNGLTTLNTFAIGARPSLALSSFFNGVISEVIIYNRALTDAQITYVNGYLFRKYGLNF